MIIKKYKLKIKAFNTHSRIEIEEIYHKGKLINRKCTRDNKKLEDTVLIEKCFDFGKVFTKEYSNRYFIKNILENLNKKSEVKSGK